MKQSRYILVFIAAIIPSLVLWDWYAPPYTHRVQDDWVTQKVSTAVLFLLSCLLVLAKSQLVADVMAIAVMAFATSAIFIGLGPAEQDAVRTIRPGIPSFFTVLGFWSLVLSRLYAPKVAFVPVILGAVAIVGYAFASPALAWEFRWSSGMALFTAVNFVLLGLAVRMDRKGDE